MKQIIKLFAIPLLGLFGSLLLHSCSKTEVVAYEKESLNKILEFKITNSPQPLLGAIDHTRNSITIYIPYYLGIDYLVPALKLEEGAILIDEKGEEINLDGGVDPIRTGETAVYRVKGTDGTVRTYNVAPTFLPFNVPLQAGYTTTMVDTNPVSKIATAQFNVYGNFASTSTHAKFYFTDKTSGKVHHDFVSMVSVLPSEAYYTLTAQLLPEALAGDYKVEVEHQGRRAPLPDMKVTYSQPFPTFFSSTASYAIGDTITFTPSSFGMVGSQGVYLELDRVYLVIQKQDATVPAGFPAALYDQQIAFPVVKQTRREVKVIVPEIPTGMYGSTAYGMVFYFDYADHTGFGKGIRTGVVDKSFEIKPKKNND